MTIHEIERIISERTGRTVTFGPLTFVDGIPRKGLLVDGVPLGFKWSPEESGTFSEIGSEKDLAEALIDIIRHGAWTYERVVEWALDRDVQLQARYEAGDYVIPHTSDREAISDLCCEIVERHLDGAR